VAHHLDPPGVVRVRADNPSPMTLDGTNTYLHAGWAIDPGPEDPAHLRAVLDAAGGALAGIVLTHRHSDHAAGAPALAAMAGGVEVVRPREGDDPGPFTVLDTPGHSDDSVALVSGRICFVGDTVLGMGSTIIQPGEGSLGAYLDSLRRLRELDVDVLCPGHGPYVEDPRAKLDEYIAHRLDRERRLLEGLAAGARTTDELLDAAWADVPEALRPAAAISLETHLEKLQDEGRLPDGVQRLPSGEQL
jgi:glyoxylase-like metal-dependent hydrolase (beta-lactamase superfamily II)